MARVSPKLSPLLKGCQQNRANWMREVELAERRAGKAQQQTTKQAGEQQTEKQNRDKKQNDRGRTS